MNFLNKFTFLIVIIFLSGCVQTNNDLNSAKRVIDKIDLIPITITIDEQELIQDAHNAYLALNDNQKIRVTNYDKLKAALDQITRELTEINEMISLIDLLPSTITIDDKLVLDDARQKFNSLNSGQQMLITNYQVLLDKEADYANIDIDAVFAEKVINAIEVLPCDITLDSNDVIKSVKELYDGLSENAKGLVTNYNKLFDQLTAIQNLRIGELDRLIITLPSIISYKEASLVEKIENKYNLLDDDEKQMFNYYYRLENAVQMINAIKNDLSTISYVLGDYIYTSKTELFTAFFTDFYYFIDYQYGKEVLYSNNIFSVSEFLNLASNMNGGDTTNMRGIGNIAGEYLLTKDLNGILADQPVTKFIGFCYQNGLYQDLLPFFINFFAFWRINEGYANLNNYGADFFAEAWAPTVDIAKFFYYDENTAYVKSERMIDCLINIAGVVYGELPSTLSETPINLPNDLKLRGYNFLGWYDNPDYIGVPITSISLSDTKVILYAKWEADQEAQDADQAALVDVYIYNLTPIVADPTKANVKRVRVLYDSLTPTAKALVNNYNTLLSHESNFNDKLTEDKTITIHLQKDDVFTSFDTMSSEFLNDFNFITNSSIQNYSEFTTARYTIMKKIATFFANEKMYTKWSFLANFFVNSPDASVGLIIQSNRILSRSTGDLEYFSKAIDAFFSKSDLTNDSEIKVDFTNSGEVCDNTSLQKIINITFKNEGALPNLVIDGLTFWGYFEDNNPNSIQHTIVTDDSPNVLYALFIRKIE